MATRRSYAFSLSAVLALGCTAHAFADDFDTARTNRLHALAGPSSVNTSDPAISAQLSSISTTANGYWQSMETGSGRTELWSDLDFPTGDANTYSAHMTSTYTRLVAMALAYKADGGTYQGNTSLRDAVLDGLAWMRANIYTTTASQQGNWWDWQIGSPLKLNDTLVLMYDDLTSTLVSSYVAPIQHFTSSPFGGGANLVWTSHVVALSGILIKNAARVSNGVSAAPPALDNVTSGEGFYADNSFIQHVTYAYTGGYGAGLVGSLEDLITEFKGTQWAYSSTVVDRESALLLNAFKPLIYTGEMQDSVRGREISRYYSTSHGSGRSVTGLFVRHAGVASSADAAKLKSAAKYWLQKDTTFAGPSYGFDLNTTVQVESLLGDSSVSAMAEPTGFFNFPSMDRFVHLRPGWGANLAMFSTRIKSYESINSENLHGWHTGDGLLTIYDGDLSQHSDNYWPTVDSYRLDGVTALAHTGISQSYGGSSFVGGVKGYGSTYGVAAMALDPSTPLTAKKAWFFFDDEIVCLGSDITATGTTNVETTLVNRKLSSTGNNTVTTNNGSSSANPVAEPATPYASSGIKYLHLAGNNSTSGIGFYFPTAVSMKALREQRTHSWTSINGNANTAEYTALYTNNFYTAYLDHGAAPTGATYAYAVLPNITASALATYANGPGFTVLENSGSAQAVNDSGAAATGAVFWVSNHTVGTGTGSITTSAPALVEVIRSGGKTSITIADPTQKLTSSFTVTLGSTATGRITSSGNVTVNSLSPITITVDPSGLAGKTSYAQFSY